MKELQLIQEKQRIIDKLCNYSQKVNSKQKDNISYFIHQIIEKDDLSLDDYRLVTSYGLLANQDMFTEVNSKLI